MIESEIFRLSQSRFAMLLLAQYGQGWIAGGVVCFITALFLGIFLDYRILVAAVLIVCLVVPGMLMVLYYNYGLRGYNYLNVNDHQLAIESGWVMVGLRIVNISPDDDGGDDVRPEEEWRYYKFSTAQFGNYTVGKDYVVFPFRNKKDGFIYLPSDSFRGKDEFMEAVRLISITKENENNKR